MSMPPAPIPFAAMPGESDGCLKEKSAKAKEQQNIKERYRNIVRRLLYLGSLAVPSEKILKLVRRRWRREKSQL